MKITDVIEPRKPHVSKWEVGTFDIETRDDNGGTALLGRFIMGATCRDNEGDTVKFYNKPVDMLKHMLAQQDKVRWFCHNGGNFDFKYIINDPECLELVKSKEYTIDVIGGKIAKGLMLRKGKKITLFCDSYKLMPMKLSKLTRDLGVETVKGHIDFDNEDFDENKPEHIEYLRDDVKSLWQIVTKYRAIIGSEFGADIKCTASSTAFNAWTTILHKKVFRHCKEVNAFARNAYYGGRTECFYQGTAHNVNYIDVNSLYAYIMHEYGGLHRPYFTTEYSGPGFYKVKAFVPDFYKFGPLPFRKPDGTGVLFPIGSFETYVSSLEIDLARELGATVDVIEGYAFDEHDKDLFKPFIEKCMELRARDYHGALGLTAKFLQNNLYGFFGMLPVRSELLFSADEPTEPGYYPAVDDKTGMLVANLWERMTEKESINCIPAFAAWITAAARCHLLRAMVAEEKAGNTVLYCDTDSVLMLGEPVSRIAEGEYGAFKLEYTFPVFRTITAKTYDGLTGRLDKDGNPERVMRCKGIPAKKLKPDMFTDALEGKEVIVHFVQLHSLSRVAKTGVLGSSNAHRRMPTIRSITTRIPSEGGYTKPHKINLENVDNAV